MILHDGEQVTCVSKLQTTKSMAFEAWVKSKYGYKVNVGEEWEQSEQKERRYGRYVSVLEV